MPVLKLNNVSLAYGHKPLLKNANLQLDTGERVCLLGRNGAGKSTLFRLLGGKAQADDGEVWFQDALRVSYLSQDVPANIIGKTFDIVAAGLGNLGQLLTEYHATTHGQQQSDLRRLSRLQHEIDLLEGWNIHQKVETVLSRLSLDEDRDFSECSGGIKRRVMLAQALVSNPDVLLLDEPTNHMDIESITWLEEFLLNYYGSIIFITHDRTLLRHLSTRIIELDRGKLTSFAGSYDDYLRQKQQMLDAEERANDKFDKKLDEYEVWVRKGIKARRTRNEGRVRQLEQMREQRKQRIEKQSTVNLGIDTGDLSGKLVIELRDINFGFGENRIVRDFSTSIMRGDRIGIIGANGSGKSTLLKLMLAELTPDSGKVIRGTNLQIAYFDQQREQLDVEASVRANISTGSDYVSIGGHSKHVVSYMKDFLFPPERINSPVKSLSGGERNRLLLARIFTRSANLLVLDEPTNDLDVETLELLEELLAEYDGTLLLVSHDRAFLDKVVTSTIVLQGNGQVREYVGGYEDWLRQRPEEKTTGTVSREIPVKQNAAGKRQNKPGYKEQRELESLPATIEKLEMEQANIESQISQGDFYRQDKEKITDTIARLEKLKTELQVAYERWEHLDSL